MSQANMFYLIDLERSVGSGIVHYWKTGQRGYTTRLEDAGIYSDAHSSQLVKEDFDQFTMRIPMETANKAIRKLA